MRALQCVELGMPDKLQVNDVPDPEASPEHVVIENKAASVNFPDVLMTVSYTHLRAHETQ